MLLFGVMLLLGVMLLSGVIVESDELGLDVEPRFNFFRLFIGVVESVAVSGVAVVESGTVAVLPVGLLGVVCGEVEDDVWGEDVCGEVEDVATCASPAVESASSAALAVVAIRMNKSFRINWVKRVAPLTGNSPLALA